MMIDSTVGTTTGPPAERLYAVEPVGVEITTQDLRNGFKDPTRWVMYSGDYTSQRRSPLTQITAANVNRLAAQWTFQTDLSPFMSTGRPGCLSVSRNGLGSRIKRGFHHMQLLSRCRMTCSSSVSRPLGTHPEGSKTVGSITSN